MKNRQKKMIVTVAVVLLVAAAGGILGYFLVNGSFGKKEKEPDPSGEVVSQAADNTVVYEGKSYLYNTDLTNILFLGIDRTEEVTLKETPGIAGQADSIMIFSLDQETQESSILQISRDSMTDVDIYDASGNYYDSEYAQLATQYAYGNGKDTSCWAMKKTVSELLYDLPIDGYVSLNMDAIPALTDALGGVRMVMQEDYTFIDPLFESGKEVILTGKQAEQFVRYRDTNEQGSNNLRMKRQTEFITAMLKTVREKMAGKEDYYEVFYPVIEPFLVTDLSADQINTFAKSDFDTSVIEFVPGKVQPGEKYEEFHVNDELLRKLMIKMFYKPVK